MSNKFTIDDPWGSPVREAASNIRRIWTPYHKDRAITQGSFFQGLESFLPILGLWRNVARAIAFTTIMAILPIIGFVLGGFVAGYLWLEAITTIMGKQSEESTLSTSQILATAALVLTFPFAILSLATAGLVALATLAAGAIALTLALEISAAAICIASTPISLVTRPTITIGCGCIHAAKALTKTLKNQLNKKKAKKTAGNQAVQEAKVEDAFGYAYSVSPKQHKKIYSEEQILWNTMFQSLPADISIHKAERDQTDPALFKLYP